MKDRADDHGDKRIGFVGKFIFQGRKGFTLAQRFRSKGMQLSPIQRVTLKGPQKKETHD
jgi:hypothetical protein